MQTLSQPTIRSGIRAAVEVGLLLPRRQRPPLSLSLPNFLISLKSGKPKPLLSPLSSYVPLHVKSSKLFSSRVSSSPVPPSSTSVNAETFKVVAEALEELNRQAKECGGFSNNICIDELDEERIRKAVLEYVREIQAEIEESDSLNYNICHHLANHVLQKNAAKGSNTLISPFSFHLLLSLIAAASKGHTLQQLFQCLKSESLEDLNSLSSKMISLASPTNGSSTGDPNLSFANGVWVSEGLKLEPSFQEIAEVVFNATAKEVDFVNNADRVVAEINVWAETATRGLIKNVLTSGALKSIDKDAALILANAIYFKGTWAQHFDTSKPKNRPFYLENGQTVDVPFTISEKYESCRYIDMGDFKILKLPFRNGQSIRNFAMYFFLPDAIDGLKKWVEMSEIGPEFFSRRFDDLPLVDIAGIWIPTFKFSFVFEASDAMKEIGLNLPFDSSKAEITEMVDSSRRLYVNKMFHKAFIDVNGEGTEAAARTASTFRPVGYPIPSFVADHPFMFTIKEETSGVMLFLGAVVNPLLQS